MNELSSERLLTGDRRALARALTLIESTRPDHRRAAAALLAELRPKTGAALRIGLSGPPGVGKSTFIEAFGQLITASGARVGVLAVDPSSDRSGGSVLGDKTRMDRLARDPNAFIRPSPAGATLGGVARRTREAAELMDAAGFGVVLIETVGVGQSETAVADMTDVFVLLVAPAGGDELQGVKRGVMERADFVLVNKADGALEPVARATAADYASALRLLRRRSDDPEDVPAAMVASARTGAGIESAWRRIQALDAWRRAEGWRDRRRRAQAARWMRQEIEQGLRAAFDADPAVAASLPALEAHTASGALGPEEAAEQALATFLSRRRGGDA